MILRVVLVDRLTTWSVILVLICFLRKCWFSIFLIAMWKPGAFLTSLKRMLRIKAAMWRIGFLFSWFQHQNVKILCSQKYLSYPFSCSITETENNYICNRNEQYCQYNLHSYQNWSHLLITRVDGRMMRPLTKLHVVRPSRKLEWKEYLMLVSFPCLWEAKFFGFKLFLSSCFYPFPTRIKSWDVLSLRASPNSMLPLALSWMDGIRHDRTYFPTCWRWTIQGEDLPWFLFY